MLEEFQSHNDELEELVKNGQCAEGIHELRIMPVPKAVNKGKRVEIRVSSLSSGTFTGASYYLRYFQYSGSGALQYFEIAPNDSYLLPRTDFRLYYTSKSETAHSFDIWIADNFGNEKQLSFTFANK